MTPTASERFMLNTMDAARAWPDIPADTDLGPRNFGLILGLPSNKLVKFIDLVALQIAESRMT